MQARRPTVVLADSDARRRRSTATVLRLGGYRVVEAATIRELPQAARDGLDVLVSNADLSDGDAVAYIAGIRRDPRTAGLPVLIVSDDPGRTGAAADALGREAALQIPVRPSVLLGAIGAAMTRTAAG